MLLTWFKLQKKKKKNENENKKRKIKKLEVHFDQIVPTISSDRLR